MITPSNKGNNSRLNTSYRIGRGCKLLARSNHGSDRGPRPVDDRVGDPDVSVPPIDALSMICAAYVLSVKVKL